MHTSKLTPLFVSIKSDNNMTTTIEIYSITPVSNYWTVEHENGSTKIGGRELRQHIIDAGLNEHYTPTNDCQDMELVVDNLETWLAEPGNLQIAVESYFGGLS